MTDFNDVAWTDDEDITASKLNAMTSNDRYLFDHILTAKYTAYEAIDKADGIKIASGIIAFPASRDRQMAKEISFGRYFSQGCRPSIQATCAVTDQVRTFCTIQAIGSGVLRPDHTGFKAVLNADPLKEATVYFPTVTHVHWLAIGY